MNRLTRTLKRFALTAAGTLTLAIIGFHTAFGATTIVNPTPAPAQPTTPPQAACVRACGGGTGWVRPVDAPVWGGFHNASNPNHQGVDLGAPKGTPIRAATAGTVVRVKCDVIPQSWGCDRDGNSNTLGCGWYVDILHPGNTYTRYCHQLRRPAVKVGDKVTTGQIIGVTGDSGHSGAPHLHFEVHIGAEDSKAVDPVAFMRNHGAPLGAN